MKTVKVRTVKGDQVQIEAINDEDLKKKFTSAFNFDPTKSIVITKPKGKPFEKYEPGETITVMGTIVKAVVPKEMEQSLMEKEEIFISNRPLRPYSKDVVFKALFDDSQFRNYSEYFSWLFLLYRCGQLRRWLLLKYYDICPAQRFIKEINRVYAKLIDQSRIAKIPMMALLLIWWGYRQFDCSKDPERANPCQLVLDWSRVICHDFTVTMKEKTDIVKQLFCVSYNTFLINPKHKGKHPIKEHFEPYLSVRTDVEEVGHLNKLFNDRHMEIPVEELEEGEIRQQLDSHEKFIKFSKLPLYLLVRINRFSSKEKTKDQRTIRFPKLLDVYKLCEPSLQDAISKGRALHNEQIARQASRIAQQRPKLKNLQGLDATQIAYSCFETIWESYLYDDRYFNLNDNDYQDCWSGCYNLIGFTTHIGEHPQQAEFATVIQMNRREWYHCTPSGISVLNLDQVLTEFNGFAKYADEPYKKDCQTAELLLYRKVYYPRDREP